MKRIFFILIGFLIISSSQAQDITGEWNGILEVQGTELNLIFNIDKSEEGYSATLDSPNQGVTGIPVSSISFKDSILELQIANAGIFYKGTYKEDEKVFRGQFKQGMLNLPLELTRQKHLLRPQEPLDLFPYTTEEVEFENPKDGITLAGTLTLPENAKDVPAVILISGSGPQNRNSEVFGHKPFLIHADHLTRNGIAVLRFDERGVGASEGNFSTATHDDFIADVKAALEYLKSREEIDNENIGLLGHSEGGIIAPRLAAESDDVEFLVLLAAPALSGDKLMLLQKKMIEEKSGVDDSTILQGQQVLGGAYDMIINSEKSTDSLRKELGIYLQEQYDNAIPEARLQALTAQLTSPMFMDIIRSDPGNYLENIEVPVLALYGKKDLQVPSEENAALMKEYLKDNENATVLELENLNHLFQESETGLSSEYAEIEQTFSPETLNKISEWIREVTN